MIGGQGSSTGPAGRASRAGRFSVSEAEATGQWGAPRRNGRSTVVCRVHLVIAFPLC